MSDAREEIKRLICESRNADIAADAILAAGYSKRTSGGESEVDEIEQSIRQSARGVRRRDTRPAGESAGVAEALTKLVEDFETDASKARHEYALSGRLDEWQSGLAAAYSSSAARLKCALGIEALAARASQPSAREVES